MRLTIVPEDGVIGIDGEFLLKIQQNLSWIPANVHAVQWYDTWGEVEFKDTSPNERIEQLGIYEQAILDFNNEKKRIEDEKIAAEIAAEAARDYWQELRFLRDERLSYTDWTQVSDAPLTESEKNAWRIYRQELRDLPENITDPKPLVLDPEHESWPIPPQ
jgi:hypothetical protein